MTNKIHFSIPKPCSANWDNMNPCNTGRFCNSCDKTVMDFTNMTAAQTTEIILKNNGKTICGRVNTKDLTPSKSKLQKFLLKKYEITSQGIKKGFTHTALLLCLGTILNLTGCDAHKTQTAKTKIAKPKSIESLTPAEYHDDAMMGKIRIEVEEVFIEKEKDLHKTMGEMVAEPEKIEPKK